MTTNGNGLYAALLAFQANAPHIPLDSTNPHFRSKFASLPNVMKLIRPALAEHGLVWTTMPSQDPEGRPTLRYRLTHAASGEHEAGEMPLLLTKSDPQGLGSALTYARRYAVLSVLGLVGDEDDDGHAGSRPQAAAAPPKATAEPTQGAEPAATAKQRGLINAKAGEKNMPASWLANVVLEAAGEQPREFDDEEHARRYVNRALDRLPARLVDPVLQGIEAA